MDILDALITRRSIRKFTGKPVAQELVDQILTAAMYAPSGMNVQPWQFVVINDAAFLAAIPEVHPYADMAAQASLAILVCADENIQTSAPRWAINCANASMNILLAAHGLGLGAVWCGVYPDEVRQRGMKNLLKLADTIHPFSLIPIGYAAESPDPGERFKPERIHYNQW